MQALRWCCVAIVSVVLVSVLTPIEGFQEYQKRIPNGDRVPNPCTGSTIWPGVCHQNSAGGGPRNPFGLDFQANGKVWNATICNKDSDGDGLTNGQELGDPECKWTVNATPSGVPMSHPGICEPLDKPDCIAKNYWLRNCKPSTFDCPAIKESGVKRFDVRLPVRPVPVQATTYICHQFKFPVDTVSDIIALEPIVDNFHVLHHMTLFACANKPPEHYSDDAFYCGMSTQCRSGIIVWTVGNPGQCVDPRVGYRIGPGGNQYGILQIHWDNHDLLSGQTDSSGLKIYYTSNLRSNRADIFAVGVEHFEIPANTPNVVVMGGCSSDCTKQIARPFNVTSALFHMHLLGRSGNVTLYRNGKYLQTIQDVRAYHFNIPAIKDFPEPLEILPGDELKVTCVYDSTGKMTPTHYGLGTYDEMCYGLLIYYPASTEVDLCIKWDTIDVCYPYNYIYSKCDITAFLQLAAGVQIKCSYGCDSPTCVNMMNNLYATGCPNQPDAMQFLKRFHFPRILLNNYTTVFRCLNATQPSPAQLVVLQ